jgi:Putative porin
MKTGLSMSYKFRATVASGLVATALIAPVGRADEVSELKAAVQALQSRLDQLESQAKSNEETNDRQTDQIAKTRAGISPWVGNFSWKGDLRYRNENIEQDYTKSRNRDRIRLRTGFVAKVNDTVKTEFGLSSAEAGDPRSSNQSLTGENTRKPIYVDLAYAEWQPRPEWKLTAGKMKYPWVRAGQSSLFDPDINPEGLAVNFARGNFFASTYYNILEERSTLGESTMAGGQVGWRADLGGGKLTLAASFFDLNSVQNRNPFYSGANGNTTKTVGCIGGSPCLENDYNLTEVLAEWSAPVAGRPLSLYADYIKNDAASNGLDTAYSAGVQYGRASDPNTWEVAYYYQSVQKDALYGQYIDSDWGAGNTDASGHVLKFGYAFAKNWALNVAYQFTKTNNDRPVNIAGIGNVFDRDYQRLQVDMNFKY